MPEDTQVQGQATVEPGAAASGNVTIDGVEYTPEQLKEFISKGTDYTKKTQQLAQQRKELETKQAEIQHLSQYADFIQRLETDQNLTNTVIRTVQQYYGGAQPTPGTQAQPQAVPTQTQINTIKQAVQDTTDDDTRKMLEDIQLDMELTKLKSKFDDFDEDAVLSFAEENGISNLEHAYKLMNFEKVQDSAAKKALENAKKGAQVPRSQSGTVGSAPGAQPTTPKTWGEAENATKEYLRAMRSQ